MNDHKALEYLENLDVLSEDYWSEDEDLISSGEGWLYGEGDRDTNENSGD